ncbi:MAG: PEP-CTERM sorting domain-containing protein [Desulfovibrionales bacterium]|nr:MAG: PEP-CTERM sorting domain-containing protein [Desulfovibrionales bacterium]
MFKKFFIGIVFSVCVAIFLATNSMAFSTGWIDTDRFGYSGTITRLSDNSLITTENIDLSLNIVSPEYEEFGGNIANIASSWWYGGSTGSGFMQYRDNGQQDVVSQQYYFDDFDGTNWTSFTFDFLAKEDFAKDISNPYISRLSITDNNEHDSGYFKTLRIQLKATGLQGIMDPTDGIIVADEFFGSFPDTVTGSISGIFENTTNSTNAGLYAFNFALNMNNWAFGEATKDNSDWNFVIDRNAMGPGNFYAGWYSAAPIPEPGTFALLGIGLFGIGVYGYRRRTRD